MQGQAYTNISFSKNCMYPWLSPAAQEDTFEKLIKVLLPSGTPPGKRRVTLGKRALSDSLFGLSQR